MIHETLSANAPHNAFRPIPSDAAKSPVPVTHYLIVVDCFPPCYSSSALAYHLVYLTGLVRLFRRTGLVLFL